jgi:hypothetical protein
VRTTFGEMHLFNEASQKHDTIFILNRKEWGVCKTETERERGGVWVEKGCALGHKLGHWPSSYEGLEKG